MVRSLLIRGMLAGVLAGLAAFAFAYLVGEPQVQQAIDFEGLLTKHAGEAGPEAVGRGVQRTVGLLTGTVVLGVAFGGMFALVYAYAYGRLGPFGPRTTAAILAAAGYLIVVLVPFLRYPAQPPGVGSPDSLDQRTLLYAAMVAITGLALLAAVRLRAQLLARLGAWDASILGAGLFLLVVVGAQLVLPGTTPAPRGFPADVLYSFRLASLGVGTTLWLTLGLAFGAAAARLQAPARRAAVPA